jgi:hypothetical protein
MSNSEQNVPLDFMIRRLEEANARVYKRVADADQRVSEPEQDHAPPHLSDQQKSTAVPASRGWLALGIVGLLLAASLGAVAFVLKSPYFNAIKMTVARALPPGQTPMQTLPAPISPELARHLQTLARDLASAAQGIEQLRTSQEQMVRDNAALSEQFKETQLQITRDNAAVADQLKAALSQMTRDSTALVEQLKASQEQMVRLTAARARRKPEATLPQAEARPQYSPLLPPRQ